MSDNGFDALLDTTHQKNVKQQITKCHSMIEWFNEQIEKQQTSLRILERALKDSYEVESDE